MARLVWTEPALAQLKGIADYIALDNSKAASKLVKGVFEAAERLAQFPESGRTPPELPNSVYREILRRPCRLFYRLAGDQVLIVHVMREEQQLRRYLLHEARAVYSASATPSNH